MATGLPKSFINYPPPLPRLSGAKRLSRILIGFILFPIYWGMAYIVGAPGMVFRSRCALMGIRLLFNWRHLGRAYNLIVSPMDSLRYFEFDFMWRAIKQLRPRTYLDVSSPRLFPLTVINRARGLVADLINPDKKDLTITISLAEALGLADRCRFHADLIQAASFEPDSFDVITSISVIEHIPDDKGAIQKMWDLLRPGGRLLVSIPCAAKASEEHININEYELIDRDKNGYVFWQRYYNEELIRQRIFEITGEPHRLVIYGEKHAGSYQENVTRKRTEPFYPFWCEPFMMGLQYEYKSKISDLPGIGVIAMEFVKEK